MKGLRVRISYWLLPIKDDAPPLRTLIDALAAEHAAPRFRPHMTLHSGDDGEDTARMLAAAAARLPMPPALACRALEETGALSKTLYIPFGTCAELEALSVHFRTGDASTAYRFVPHLSLLYKPLPPGVRADLASRFAAPLESILFDRVQAVRTEGDLGVKDDVEAWRVIAEVKLAVTPPRGGGAEA